MISTATLVQQLGPRVVKSLTENFGVTLEDLEFQKTIVKTIGDKGLGGQIPIVSICGTGTCKIDARRISIED